MVGVQQLLAHVAALEGVEQQHDVAVGGLQQRGLPALALGVVKGAHVDRVG